MRSLLTALALAAALFVGPPAAAQIFSGGGSSSGARACVTTVAQLAPPSSVCPELEGQLAIATDAQAGDLPNRCQGAGGGSGTAALCVFRDGVFDEVAMVDAGDILTGTLSPLRLGSAFINDLTDLDAALCGTDGEGLVRSGGVWTCADLSGSAGSFPQCTHAQLAAGTCIGTLSTGQRANMTDGLATDAPNRCHRTDATGGGSEDVQCLWTGLEWVEFDPRILLTAAEVEACVERDIEYSHCLVGAHIDTGEGLVLNYAKGDGVGGAVHTLECLPGAGFYTTSSTDTVRTLELVYTELEHDHEINLIGCRIDYSIFGWTPSSGGSNNETALTITHGFPTGATATSSGRTVLSRLHIGQDGKTFNTGAERAFEYRGDPADGYGTRDHLTIEDSFFEGNGDLITISSKQDPLTACPGVECDGGAGRFRLIDSVFQGPSAGASPIPACFLEQSESPDNGSWDSSLIFDNAEFQLCAPFTTNISQILGNVVISGFGDATNDQDFFDLRGTAVLAGEAEILGARVLDVDVSIPWHGSSHSNGPLVVSEDTLKTLRVRLHGNGVGGRDYDSGGYGRQDAGVPVFWEDQGSTPPTLVDVLVAPPDGYDPVVTEIVLASTADLAGLDTAGSSVRWLFPGGATIEKRYRRNSPCASVTKTTNYTLTASDMSQCTQFDHTGAVADVTFSIPTANVPPGSRVCFKHTNGAGHDLIVDPGAFGENFMQGDPTLGGDFRLSAQSDRFCWVVTGDAGAAVFWDLDPISQGSLVEVGGDAAKSVDHDINIDDEDDDLTGGEGSGDLRIVQSLGTALDQGDEVCAAGNLYGARECVEVWDLGTNAAPAFGTSPITCATDIADGNRMLVLCVAK